MSLNINPHIPANIQNLAAQSNSPLEKETLSSKDKEQIDALCSAARLLANDKLKEAEKIIKEKYPFIPIKRESRKASQKQLMEQFFRDGFIDRYSGKKLVNPGMLRTMSLKIPEAFPYQSSWKVDECHIAYWDYYPTLDHIHPIALGGKDVPENWVSTSMVYNSAKSNFTLEQIGWKLKDKGDIKDWDGLSGYFIKTVEKDKSLLEINAIKSWYTVTKETMKKFDFEIPVPQNGSESRKASDYPKNLFNIIDSLIIALSPDIERTPTKRYYSYKVKNVFTAIDIQKQRLKVFLYIPYEQVRFSDNNYREKLGFTPWEGKAAFFFEHLSDIAVVMNLIEQSYKLHADS